MNVGNMKLTTSIIVLRWGSKMPWQQASGKTFSPFNTEFIFTPNVTELLLKLPESLTPLHKTGF